MPILVFKRKSDSIIRFQRVMRIGANPTFLGYDYLGHASTPDEAIRKFNLHPPVITKVKPRIK